jgi:uncharacterized protein involved in cysteine biosynthesis
VACTRVDYVEYPFDNLGLGHEATRALLAVIAWALFEFNSLRMMLTCPRIFGPSIS